MNLNIQAVRGLIWPNEYNGGRQGRHGTKKECRELGKQVAPSVVSRKQAGPCVGHGGLSVEICGHVGRGSGI